MPSLVFGPLALSMAVALRSAQQNMIVEEAIGTRMFDGKPERVLEFQAPALLDSRLPLDRSTPADILKKSCSPALRGANLFLLLAVARPHRASEARAV